MISLIIGPDINAQQPEFLFQTVGELDEYSSPLINCIFQDSKGLIWIGTENGLDQWDGNQITNFTNGLSHSRKLTDVSAITEDDRNNLWIIAIVGDQTWSLIRFEMESQKFNIIPLTYENKTLLPTFVQFNPAGILWLGCLHEGIFQFDTHIDSLQPILVKNPELTKIQYHQIVSVETDSTGKIWVADAFHGLHCYNEENGILIHQDVNESTNDKLFCRDMESDPEGNFWLLKEKSGLSKFNPYTHDIQEVIKIGPDSLIPPYQDQLKVDSKGRIWYGQGQSLRLYDPSSELLTTFELGDNANYSIKDIFIDDQENFLVATNNGVLIFHERVAVRTLLNEFRDTIIKSSGWINSMVQSGADYWIGTSKTGLIRYNSDKKSSRYYTINDRSGTAPYRNIFRVLKDRTGRIWVMDNDGLHRYNPETDDFEQFEFSYSHYVMDDEEGNFWVCEMRHLRKFDPITLTTSSIKLKQSFPVLGTDQSFNPLTQDQDGIFWFGGWGLFRIDPKTGTWKQFTSSDDENSLVHNNVTDILCDSRNRLWITTPVGVDRLIAQPGSDSVVFYHQQPGDGSNINASKIVEDSAGNICVATHSGIYVIRENNQLEKYTLKDGHPQVPLMTRWMGLDSKGILYAGTVDLTRIPPQLLKPNKQPPPIVLTGFRVSGKLITPGSGSPLEKSVQYAEKIDLKHDQNFIRIDFSALNYSGNQKNRYRYLLQGMDKDTVFSGEKSYAEYTDLSPGKYKFWVTASNSSGVWNPSGATLLIRVYPPWYRSMVAFIIWGFLLIMFIMGIIRLRTRMLWRAKTQLEIEVANRMNEIRWMNEQIIEMEAMKTRFFYNISHEFRNLISLISAPIECVREDSKISNRCRIKLDVARRNAFKLTSLVDQLLDISKIDKGSLKLVLTRTSIYNFVHAIAVSFVSLAETKGIHYIFNIPSTESEEWFDTNKLEKITNNLLSNAFKFTDEGGMVVLDMEIKSKQNGFAEVMEIVVRDTGSGIPKGEHEKIFDRFYQAESTLSKEGGGAGIGLALTSDLIDLMHGTIFLESEVGIGSTFRVQIPLGKDHLIENEFSISSNELEMGTRGSTSAFMQKDTLECEFEQKQEEFIPDEAPLILVVEDNREIRSMISTYLEAHFRVVEAVDGSAGLKIAIEKLPDLVLTDLIMPRMDGIEMCSLLKTDLRTSHIPVIMLTAKSTRDNRLEGLETGADDYISKPFDLKEVVARINNLVEQRKKLKEKFSQTISLETHDVFVSSMDQKFLTQVLEVIENHMSSEKFDVGELCRELNISRSTLSRKLNALTGLSPLEFIRNSRLQRAASLLNQQFGNITQVAMEVGFSNPSYFTRMFRKTYKVSPSEYAKNLA